MLWLIYRNQKMNSLNINNKIANKCKTKGVEIKNY